MVPKKAENLESDPVAKAKLDQAEKARLTEEVKIAELLADINDPKKQKNAISIKMKAFTLPKSMMYIGYIFTLGVGFIAPLFGWFLMECMNGINLAFFTGKSVMDEVLIWILLMVAGAFILLFTVSISKVALSRVSENVTKGMRLNLYTSCLRKDIGWHDDRDNSAGILTATLASDVQLLNGITQEGTAAAIEGGVALLWSICVAFYFSWPMALVCLITTPAVLISGAIAAKADMEQNTGMKEDEASFDKSDDLKQSQRLADDSILNYKTVASFGNDQILIDEFKAINLRKAKADNKAAWIYALSLGISVGVQNAFFAILYIAAAELYAWKPTYEYTQNDVMFVAMFVFIFGVFTAAQSAAMGPDGGKALTAGKRIFSVIDRPSKIDVMDDKFVGSKK